MQNVRQGKGGKGGKGGGKGDPAPGGMPRPAGVALLALALLAPASAAQGHELLVSLSGDDTLPGGAVRDQDLVRHAPGVPAFVAWPSETLTLLAGAGGSGTWPVFGDIDAVHDAGGATADAGLYLSLGSDEAGFKDGDVFRGGAGAYAVFRTEAEFIAAAGASDGNVDVDAFHLDPDGTILFSFADNEASAFLSGDDPGVVKDGDVLAWPAGAATAFVLLTEAQVSQLVTTALASPSALATTDTTALARDPQTGDVLFAVQSPTANDATVFTTALGGSILEGHAEPDFGFSGSPELDALSIAGSVFPVASVSTPNPAAGSSFELRLAGAVPGSPHILLAALGLDAPQPQLSGWGGFVLAQDALLDTCWTLTNVLLVVPGSDGSGTYSAAVPAGLPPVDVVLQVVAPAAAGQPASGSNPLLIELAQ